MKQIKLGITGGIGSGKSVVSHLLQLMGVPVYISDTETKQLMLTDATIRSGLIALLGEEVYHNQTLNKPLLASYLFGSPEHARQVNAIIHPRVKEDFRYWAEAHATSPIVAIESAILYEAGFAPEVDRVLMVYAPEELRIARAVQRDTSTREQIEKRVRAQMNDEEKRAKADFCIVNDGETALSPQLLQLISLLTKNNVLPLSTEIKR